MSIQLKEKTAVITGAGSGIGKATAVELAQRGVRQIALIDLDQAGAKAVEAEINDVHGRALARSYIGDTGDVEFRRATFHEVRETQGVPQILVPAAGITRDRLAVKRNKRTGEYDIYPVELFRQVMEVNLVAPIYWSLELIAQCAQDREQRGLGRWQPEEGVQGSVIFIGSVSSRGNRGQISYATTKAGLEGAAATLTVEGMYHGVRFGVIHPGFTDTPMVRAIGEEYIEENILPFTLLRRLIQPEEIADAICFMITNATVSGELWADAGWHPST